MSDFPTGRLSLSVSDNLNTKISLVLTKNIIISIHIIVFSMYSFLPSLGFQGYLLTKGGKLQYQPSPAKAKDSRILIGL